MIALLTALGAALITAIATLIAVSISQKHNRELKIIELREETARMIRQEKREVYLEVLKSNKMAVQYAVQLGYMSLGQQLRVDPDALDAASNKFEELIPEIEIVASREIYDLSQRLYQATSACMDTMYRENERYFEEFARRHPDQDRPSSEQAKAIWEKVRARVQEEYEKQGIDRLYHQLRSQIREELGFLALDPSLVPTLEETEKLRKELINLNRRGIGLPQQTFPETPSGEG